MPKQRNYKTVREQMTVEDALSSFSDLDELRDELDSWKSGMEGTGLEQSEKYSTLEESVSGLEEVHGKIESAVSGMDLPDEVSGHEITVTYNKPYGKDPMTRVQRCGYVTACLSASVEFLRDFTPSCETCDGEGSTKCGECDGEGCDECSQAGTIECSDCSGTGEGAALEVDNELGEIEDACSGLDNVEFPRMYG